MPVGARPRFLLDLAVPESLAVLRVALQHIFEPPILGLAMGQVQVVFLERIQHPGGRAWEVWCGGGGWGGGGEWRAGWGVGVVLVVSGGRLPCAAEGRFTAVCTGLHPISFLRLR